MEIILLRHGEVKENQDGKLSVENHSPLTETGVLQSHRITDVLLKQEISTVLVSPLLRAIDTIRPYCETSGHQIVVIPELSEGHLMLSKHIEPEQPEYTEEPTIGKVPITSESDGQFYSRARQAVKIILDQNAKCILVVTHGHMIRELLNQFLATTQRIRFPHGNCHASSISVSKDLMVNYLNKDYALTNVLSGRHIALGNSMSCVHGQF